LTACHIVSPAAEAAAARGDPADNKTKPAASGAALPALCKKVEIDNIFISDAAWLSEEAGAPSMILAQLRPLLDEAAGNRQKVGRGNRDLLLLSSLN
jgi:hypothetical protein